MEKKTGIDKKHGYSVTKEVQNIGDKRGKLKHSIILLESMDNRLVIVTIEMINEIRIHFSKR
jgi:hypothetical protein